MLEWVINSPYCDKGTALLTFWRAEPDFYTRFTTEEEADYQVDVWRLVTKIIKNFETGFYQKEEIKYDPEEDGHDVNYVDKKAKWQIPDFMKKPTQGEYTLVEIDY